MRPELPGREIQVTYEQHGLLANLSGSAAKLLLHAMWYGTLKGDAGDLMRDCGIGSRTTFFKARNELLENGMLTADFRPASSGTIFDTRSTVFVPTGPESVPTQVQKVDSQAQKVDLEESPESVPEPPSLMDEAEELDAMPDDGGSDRWAKTNWQKRRNAHVAFVVRFWPVLFPQSAPMTKEYAARMLQVASNSVSEVLSACLYTSESRNIKGNGAKSYVEKVLLGRKKEQAAPQRSSQSDEPEFVGPEWQAALDAFDPKSVGWEDDVA
jgi:hypothetical protein